ncbi:hypothetical protein ACLKA7_000002 [Drosophila subpalustris]
MAEQCESKRRPITNLRTKSEESIGYESTFVDAFKRVTTIGCGRVPPLGIVSKKKKEAQRTQRRQKCWVNSYLQLRKEKGRFQNDFQNMVQNPNMFYQNFHMGESQFNHLFSLVEPFLVPKRNSRPDAIPLKAKLAIVLE